MAEPIILPYNKITPQISPTAFIAQGAAIIGDVVIGGGTSVWFNVTIRGDVNTIRIGKNSNIQDGTVCHVTCKTGALTIGDGVTIGHNAIIHGCTVENNSFVGMGATVMDGAVVKTGAMVAAGALVSSNKVVKTGELWAGIPAKCIRKLTQEEIDYFPWSAEHYRKLGVDYRK